MIPVGERVKLARNHAGLSQKELAERAGVTQQVISTLERGITTSCREMRSLAQACGVDFDWLDTGAGDMFGNHTQTFGHEASRILSFAHLSAAKHSLLAAIASLPPQISQKEALKLLRDMNRILSKLSP
jgi:transcriptional regulator with XRE-family HTH domain